MAADTTVKFFHSAMPSAPVLSGTAGSCIGVLDACLVNGFGTGTVDSIVVSGGIATVTRSTGHSFEVGSVALIAGSTVTGGTPGALNGEKKVLSTTTTTYTFDATGVSDQSATGTITHKLAPAGWLKPYSGTNLAAYKSADVASTGCYLRVDDTNGNNARVVGYESMTDVNTGTGQFPTTSQLSGGGFWAKSNNLDSSGRSWMLVADGRFFVLMIAYGSSSQNYFSSHAAFGDLIAVKSPDPYACHIQFQPNSVVGGSSWGDSVADLSSNNSSTSLYAVAPRSYTAVGGSTQMRIGAPMFVTSSTSNVSGQNTTSSHLSFPNPTDGGLYLTPTYSTEWNTAALRGTIPGVYYCPMKLGNAMFNPRDAVTGVTGLSGRTLKAVTNASGCMFIDTTGPWR